MTSGLVPLLWKFIGWIDFHSSCLTSCRGASAEVRVANDEVDLALKTNHVVLVKVL